MVLGYASLWKRPHVFRCVASLLAPLGLLRTGITRYLAPRLRRGSVRTFLPDNVGATARYNVNIIQQDMEIATVYNITALLRTYILV